VFKKLRKIFSTIFGSDEKPGKNVKRSAGKAGAVQTKQQKKNKNAAVKVKKQKQERKNNVSEKTVRKKLTVPESFKDVPVVENKVRFLDIPLHPLIQHGIQKAGFEYCTPIQEMALPALLENRDLAGKAQTGTGKTAAFLLASFTKLLNNPLPESERKKGQPRMVVMAPTRELAIQIHNDAEELGVYSGLETAVVFGGMDHETQRRSLERPLDLLVGTPGRVIDYSLSKNLDLSKVEILVIDEADRMLDMGFIPDVKRIVSQMPPKGKRQTLLFSATLEDTILRLASGWLADPVVYESEPENMVSENITQTFYSVLREDKLALTLYILRTMEYERLLIFGNRKDVNLMLQYDLARYGFRVPVLSGDISQEKRIRILEKFRSGKEKIVIATDVAARGIHVDDVSIVINYDLPEQPEDYIHRIGRTGRAGKKGLAVSFLCEYGAYYLPAIEKLLDVQFSSDLPTEEMLQLPPEEEGSKLPRPERKKTSGRSGRSPFKRSLHRR